MKLYQNDWKIKKIWRRKEELVIQSILHRLLDMVEAMLWLFIDDVATAGSSRMNSNVYRDILDHTNESKHAVNATQEFLKAKTRILQWPEENRK